MGTAGDEGWGPRERPGLWQVFYGLGPGQAEPARVKGRRGGDSALSWRFIPPLYRQSSPNPLSIVPSCLLAMALAPAGNHGDLFSSRNAQEAGRAGTAPRMCRLGRPRDGVGNGG